MQVLSVYVHHQNLKLIIKAEPESPYFVLLESCTNSPTLLIELLTESPLFLHKAEPHKILCVCVLLFY